MPKKLTDLHNSSANGYFVAGAAVLTATILRLMLTPLLDDRAPFLPFVLAVMVAASIAGRGPGLVAAVMSTLCVWFFFVPTPYSFRFKYVADAVNLGLFLLVGGGITLLCEQLRNAVKLATRTERTSEALLESASQAIIGATADGRIVIVNAMTERMFDYSREELLGQPLEMLVPRGRRNIHQAHRRAFQGNPTSRSMGVGMHLSGQRKDGTEFPAEVSLSSVPTDHGQISVAFVTDISERKRAEEALANQAESLRSSQARLASMLAAGSIGTWTWDIANDRLTADEFTARLFSVEPGAAAKGLPAEAYLRAVMEEDQSGVAAGLARAIESCSPYDMEYRVQQNGGELRWIQAKGRVEGDAAGHAVHFHGAVIDITERKRTEGRFRRLVDSNAQGVMFWNLKGEVTKANDALLRMVGYTRDDLEAGLVNWAAMTPPEYADVDRRCLEELASKGICTPFEKVYVRKDGAHVPILIGAATFEESPDEGVCFVLDITERKQTDRTLRESEEHFRLLNDLSQATRRLTDPRQIMAVTARLLGEHLRVSRCAYADMNEDGDQFTILHDYTDGCASTVGDYQLSRFGERAVATLHAGQPLIIRNVDEELLPGEGADMFNATGIKAIITCSLVKEGGLRALMAVHQTTARDWKPAEITIVQDVVERCWATVERRNAEENIQRLNAELEQRVIERTAQLEAANKELEAFSYSVSHDLRAPLRTVDGFSQAVLEDYGPQLPEEGRRYLQTIRDGTQRMGALIDDLLDFARLSQQSLRKRTVDTEKLVQNVIEDLASQREGRQIEILIGDLPPCHGDRALLKQVWFNLLSNALKYTRKRERAVLEIGCAMQKDKEVYFVRDNGTGFDMQYADKLFGVFQRLHRAEDYEGTGVGLAIVQRVIHRHGGRIWAEAAVDNGATFSFTLQEETP